MNYQQQYAQAPMMDPYASAAAAAAMQAASVAQQQQQAPDYSYASAAATYGAAAQQQQAGMGMGAAAAMGMGGMAGMVGGAGSAAGMGMPGIGAMAGMVPPQQQAIMPQATVGGFEYGAGQQKYAPHMAGGVAAPYYGATPAAVVPPARNGSVASNTSSKDPQALRARVFVGNLNTSIVNRDQVHQIYAPFGTILAISLHKGFAFVQYAYESEARSAVQFTDGTLLGGKTIDVTISSEPKKSGSSANESSFGNKRPASAANNFGPDTKRMNTTLSPSVAFKKPAASFSSLVKPATTTLNKITTVSVNGSGPAITIKQEILDKGEDIFICGRCRESFNTILLFSTHKSKCTAPQVANGSLKVVKSEEKTTATTVGGGSKGKPDGEPAKVNCFICHVGFDYSWHLLQHMSQKHSMTVYDSAAPNGVKTEASAVSK